MTRRALTCITSPVPNNQHMATSERFLLIVISTASLFIARQGRGAERLDFSATEAAGLARRGFPTHVQLELPKPIPASTKFRLLRDDQPIVAQFRADGEGPTRSWWLDFQANSEPNESRNYRVEYGDDVAESPELARGHELTQSTDSFLVTHAPYITWTIPKDLKGLLTSVTFQEFEFLRSGADGLLLRDRQSNELPLRATGGVTRSGRMAMGLRYQSTSNPPNASDLRSTVDLTLPGPVSWIEVNWTIDDPSDQIEAAGLKLNLNLDPPDKSPMLTDFGAGSMVYLAVYPGQVAELVAGQRTISGSTSVVPFWEVLRREPNRVIPVASRIGRSAESAIEGWAHMMDRKKCLALAVDAFGRDTTDRIQTAADGRLELWREFPGSWKGKQKRLRFWLHFVFFPPQASAGTTPQQMQSPLKIKVLD